MTPIILLSLTLFITINNAEWKDAQWIDIPYMVTLRHSVHGHWCGGSILSLSNPDNGGKGEILTAAHCVNADIRQIGIGCTNTDCRSSDGRTLYDVESSTIHPEYTEIRNDDWVNNDIAIITLTTPITHPGSRSIIIESDRNSIMDGNELMATGYFGRCGYAGSCQGGSDLDTLEYFTTHFMDQTECYNVWQNFAGLGNYVVGEYDFCMVDEYSFDGSDTICGGDSGSPILARGRQIGLVSWAHSLCNPTIAQVGTYIPYYYDWIQSECGSTCGREIQWGAEMLVGGWALFEGTGKWYQCPAGFVVGGFWKNTCQSLYCLEEMKCVKPAITSSTSSITPGSGISTIKQTCYIKDIWAAFDGAGTVECDSGYFVRGIWSNENSGGGCGLYCWELLECCKYDESIIETSVITEDHDWWSCFDGNTAHWCLTNNDQFITGFYKTADNYLYNLELAKVRHLYLKKECKHQLYDSNWLGLGQWTPTQNKQITTINIGEAMSYSMDITVNAFPTGWANIFHCGAADAVRLPGIWLHDQSNDVGALHEGFHISYSTETNSNPWINPGPELVTGKKYHLEIRVTQSSFIAVVNGNVEYQSDVYSKHSLFANVPCYVSNPWVPAADVLIENIQIVEYLDDATCGETQNLVPIYPSIDYKEDPQKPDYPVNKFPDSPQSPNKPKDIMATFSPKNKYWQFAISTTSLFIIGSLLIVIVIINCIFMMKYGQSCCNGENKRYQIVKQLDTETEI